MSTWKSYKNIWVGFNEAGIKKLSEKEYYIA